MAWRFVRFDSAGYFLSRSRSLVTVWRSQTLDPRGLKFDPTTTVCQIDVRAEGDVISSEFQIVVSHHVPVLRVAVLMQTRSQAFQLRTYEMASSPSCPLISVFELKGVPRKVAFVSSHYEAGVVVLVEGRLRDLSVDLKQGSRSAESSSRLIEVSAQHAIDMEAFSVAGHSFIVTAHERGSRNRPPETNSSPITCPSTSSP